ncbi:hypothetical protein QAD02_021548 [Eretmocerus hayati]|uniref:Uncharacterized protein n=1 Tax=Eretmocerus hayati TaxID=131215 RepID=A0ACC2PVD4_9HYME|nr:hypothetical protein QAD02_021548 [Eretmocerus hayati]
MPDNIRNISVRSRGQFAKKGTRERIEKLLERNRAGKKRKAEDTDFEVLPKVPKDCIKYDGRIIDMDHVGAQMWCLLCKIPLPIQYLVKEVHQGIASKLSIKCCKCDNIVRIDTSKKAAMLPMIQT